MYKHSGQSQKLTSSVQTWLSCFSDTLTSTEPLGRCWNPRFSGSGFNTSLSVSLNVWKQMGPIVFSLSYIYIVKYMEPCASKVCTCATTKICTVAGYRVNACSAFILHGIIRFSPKYVSVSICCQSKCWRTSFYHSHLHRHPRYSTPEKEEWKGCCSVGSRKGRGIQWSVYGCVQ